MAALAACERWPSGCRYLDGEADPAAVAHAVRPAVVRFTALTGCDDRQILVGRPRPCRCSDPGVTTAADGAVNATVDATGSCIVVVGAALLPQPDNNAPMATSATAPRRNREASVRFRGSYRMTSRPRCFLPRRRHSERKLFTALRNSEFLKCAPSRAQAAASRHLPNHTADGDPTSGDAHVLVQPVRFDVGDSATPYLSQGLRFGT